MDIFYGKLKSGQDKMAPHPNWASPFNFEIVELTYSAGTATYWRRVE